MSVDQAFREMIRSEIELQLRPLRDVVQRLEAGTADLSALRDVAEQLVPLAGFLGPLFGVRASPQVSALPARRGPGRPPKSPTQASPAEPAQTGARRGRKPAEDAGRACAISGCGNPSRTKGYCGAHYQKLRMLERTKRRPANWVDYAQPGSVEDLKLPRGRAASKALAANNSST